MLTNLTPVAVCFLQGHIPIPWLWQHLWLWEHLLLIKITSDIKCTVRITLGQHKRDSNIRMIQHNQFVMNLGKLYFRRFCSQPKILNLLVAKHF